ncbi:DUF6318 family protein [Kribbella sp. GL6]|uniref:DUF6318 family protein n=1 Tax=Kribbella sp. GL6 TaxID=3419765 RepID=UPI003D047163
MRVNYGGLTLVTHRNRPTQALLACLATTTLLTACTTPSPKAAQPNTAPPPASGTPTGSANETPSSPGPTATGSSPSTNGPTAPPTRPPSATGPSLAAGEAFIGHYVALLNYAYATGDTGPMMAASDKGCIGCKGVSDYTKKYNASRGTLAGDYNDRLISVKEIYRGKSGRLGGSATLKTGSYTERDSPSASPVPQGNLTGTMEFTLSASGGNWVMYEMEIKE